MKSKKLVALSILIILSITIVIPAKAGIHPVTPNSTVFAASPTPTKTATPSATPTEKVATIAATPSQTEDIQEKIKSLVKENLTATESNLKEKINQKTLVGYVGYVKSINSGNITLTSKDESLIQITTDDKTAYIKEAKPGKLTTIAISDKIIVIGTLLKEDIILAKRIIVIKEDPSAMVSGTIFAKVSSVDAKKKIIGLSIEGKEVLYTLTKKSTIVITDIKPGSSIFAITKKFEGKDYLSTAKVI